MYDTAALELHTVRDWLRFAVSRVHEAGLAYGHGCTNAYDEALALPTEDSARLALRTQQILAHESGVAQTVDPLGGSYYVESLTAALAREARALLRHVDALGGLQSARENPRDGPEPAEREHPPERRPAGHHQLRQRRLWRTMPAAGPGASLLLPALCT